MTYDQIRFILSDGLSLLLDLSFILIQIRFYRLSLIFLGITSCLSFPNAALVVVDDLTGKYVAKRRPIRST